MQTVQILIEENAYGAVRPMEVVATAPVAALVPAIVEELKLPQTDLFGNKLVYVLRHHSGGPIIPEYKSLEASGVNPGTKLSLDSYVVDGSVATLFKSEPVQAPHSFYSSQTMTDVQSFPELGKDTSASFPVVGHKKKSRRWTRRALLVAGGAALGAGGLGLGYAVYRSMIDKLYHITNNEARCQRSMCQLHQPSHNKLCLQKQRLCLSFRNINSLFVR